MRKYAHRKGFTLVELVFVFSVVAIMFAIVLLCMKGIYRSANSGPGMQAAERFYQDIMEAAGETPFDEAIRGTGDTSVLVGRTLLRMEDYFAEPYSITWDTTTYKQKTLIVETKTLLNIYITADGPSFDKPPRNR